MLAADSPFHKIPTDELRSHPYLTSQLLAYIGNKRALLPFLHRAFSEIVAEPARAVFLDPFAGTGAVSRLAKSMGFEVHANDWEFYSWVVNACQVGIDRKRARVLFCSRMDRVFDDLNSIGLSDTNEPGLDPYVSRYFAPADTLTADYRRERMFYTRENALFIDRVRGEIEERYPGWELPPAALEEKLILVASLLVEAATHANTSGVFKAYHKGFGGHGRDALGRILSPMRLEAPELIDGRRPARVARLDAAVFARGKSVDLAYLDPPYTTHQYGSNYFMLNTIALWDRPPVSTERTNDGRLKEKAAIRHDWTRTRSDYCYSRTAPGAFASLLGAVDARYIAVSYNTEGLIPLPELVDMLAGRGRVSIYASDYTKYRGGKQSLSRTVSNVEFLLVVDTAGSTSAVDRSAVDTVLLRKRAATLMAMPFAPERILRNFSSIDGGVVLGAAAGARTLAPMRDFHRFAPSGCFRIAAGGRRAPGIDRADPCSCLDAMGTAELESLIDALSRCVCADNSEEARVIIRLLGRADRPDPKLATRLLIVSRKLASRKHRASFEKVCVRIENLIGALRGDRSGCPATPVGGDAGLDDTASRRMAAKLEQGLKRLRTLAEKRIAG